MTTHNEAREAVARAIGGNLDVADNVLALLGELGYVQRDRLLGDEAMEDACRKQTNTPHPAWLKPGQRDLMRSAIAAAIAEVGESA